MDQITEAKIEATKAEIRREINSALSKTAADIQDTVDKMQQSWQLALDKTVEANARAHLANAEKAKRFYGLFEAQMPGIEKLIDDSKATAPQLQRELYKASDNVVGSLNHGKNAKFYHVTRVEAFVAAGLAVVSTLAIRAGVAKFVSRGVVIKVEANPLDASLNG